MLHLADFWSPVSTGELLFIRKTDAHGSTGGGSVCSEATNKNRLKATLRLCKRMIYVQWLFLKLWCVKKEKKKSLASDA